MGLRRVKGGHAAENSKKNIEETVALYKFDKSKIKVNIFPLNCINKNEKHCHNI
jgi:hypothetical protein